MHKMLYKVARKINRAATVMNDVETIATGNPKKIAKRFARKATYKASHGGANKLARKVLKWTKW